MKNIKMILHSLLLASFAFAATLAAQTPTPRPAVKPHVLLDGSEVLASRIGKAHDEHSNDFEKLRPVAMGFFGGKAVDMAGMGLVHELYLMSSLNLCRLVLAAYDPSIDEFLRSLLARGVQANRPIELSVPEKGVGFDYIFKWQAIYDAGADPVDRWYFHVADELGTQAVWLIGSERDPKNGNIFIKDDSFDKLYALINNAPGDIPPTLLASLRDLVAISRRVNDTIAKREQLEAAYHKVMADLAEAPLQRTNWHPYVQSAPPANVDNVVGKWKINSAVVENIEIVKQNGVFKVMYIDPDMTLPDFHMVLIINPDRTYYVDLKSKCTGSFNAAFTQMDGIATDENGKVTKWHGTRVGAATSSEPVFIAPTPKPTATPVQPTPRPTPQTGGLTPVPDLPESAIYQRLAGVWATTVKDRTSGTVSNSEFELKVVNGKLEAWLHVNGGNDIKYTFFQVFKGARGWNFLFNLTIPPNIKYEGIGDIGNDLAGMTGDMTSSLRALNLSDPKLQWSARKIR